MTDLVVNDASVLLAIPLTLSKIFALRVSRTHVMEFPM